MLPSFISPNAPGQYEILIVSEDPLRLVTQAGPPLMLTVEQRYTIVEAEEARGPWKVSTRGYRYQLMDESGRDLAGWHWHPLGLSSEQRPHLHVYEGHLTRLHLPTSRVSFESVLRLLLTELGVRPKRADWAEVLDVTEAAFRQWCTWN